MRELTRKYLENLREAFIYISHDSGSGFFTPYSALPLFVLVFVTATASSTITCITSILFSIIVLLYIGATHGIDDYNTVLKNITILSVMVFIVSIPAIIAYGVGSVYMFVARTISSTTIFISMLHVIGWWNIVRGLEVIKTPRVIIEMIYQTVKFIPLFLNETLKLLAAREARVVGRTSTKGIWRLLSSIVAELIVKAYHRSLMMNMALNARTLSVNKHLVYKTTRPTIYDVCLIMFALVLLLYEVVYRAWSGLL